MQNTQNSKSINTLVCISFDGLSITMKTLMKYIPSLLIIIMISCSSQKDSVSLIQVPNVLDFSSKPIAADYRESLVFSDQGAWFGYGLDTEKGGFTGPFLMTQENGTWISSDINKLLFFDKNGSIVNFELEKSSSYLSHLEQNMVSNDFRLLSKLYFEDSESAIIQYRLINISEFDKEVSYAVSGKIINSSMVFSLDNNCVKISSQLYNTIGFLNYPDDHLVETILDSSAIHLIYDRRSLSPGQEIIIYIKNKFYSNDSGVDKVNDLNSTYRSDSAFVQNDFDKTMWLFSIQGALKKGILDEEESNILVNKCLMTLQNNWRTASGDLKHAGLFPSYHYYWFHGFWAWDSWKHAYVLAEFFPNLAKQQILAMYDYMDDKGFIADCIYRDTLIENHNLRNTKPPLSAWAAWNIYKNDSDTGFLEKIYPALLKQHYWWYSYRDIDNDGICEYGCTDGTLVAAKWESGMDNAVRFDNSQILLNNAESYSLDQESIDLNSYLYAEKIILSKMATLLGKNNDKNEFQKDAANLKYTINNQFFDKESGWYYDTSLDGKTLIREMGCEGWIPLWAGAATAENAQKVRLNMVDSTRFNIRVPLQTLSADNPKFKPDRGYWRGPVWLDQAYFGIVGLRNYGYNDDADMLTKKLIQNSEGLLELGPSIRENYNPITGKGMEARNFSWSAAHFLLLIME